MMCACAGMAQADTNAHYRKSSNWACGSDSLNLHSVVGRKLASSTKERAGAFPLLI